jgi:hypothetical protein
MMRTTFSLASAAAILSCFAAPAGAQRGQQPPRRQTIEIRGQVPTPQVVTVRPREIPSFERTVLVPGFYNHTFWPMVLPAYQIVQKSDVLGRQATDSMPVISGAAPAVGQPVVPLVPQPVQRQQEQVKQAEPPATRTEEIEALRRELEARRARLDSLEATRLRQLDSLEKATRERHRREMGDTLRKPPGTPNSSQQ